MYLLLPCKLLRIQVKSCIYHPLHTTMGLQVRLLANKVTAAVGSSDPVLSKSEDTNHQNGTFSPTNKVLRVPPSLLASQLNSAKEKNISADKDWREVATDIAKLPHYYLMLSKFRLTSLVVMTSMAGYALAPAPFDFSTFALLSLGTGLVSCAANSINQFFEVPFDSQMSRTKNRILVRGYLTPLHALTFATVCGVTGLTALYCGINGLTASLGALNLGLYTMVYTPMKRVSILNTWLGSVVGAIPPLMGWAACAGALAPGAWVLAGILYAWQFPHFNALSWNLRPDYSRAGYRMMAVTNPDLCRKTALRYTAALLALSCASPALDVTNWLFAIESVPLNAYFTYLAWQFYQKPDSATSRKLFRFSLLHLPLLMLLLLINKKYWSPQTKVSKSSQKYTDIFTVLPTEPLSSAALLETPSVPAIGRPILATSNS